ncbi:hypothetical protein KAT24_01725 [Candidatus Pacearchaeota archaeon]|nr:hypothetical protein [Candidatus Pacearchaeota archaeon]
MKVKELLRDFIAIILFVALSIIFYNFIEDNSRAFGIAFLFFLVNYLIIFLHERKYKKNFPYKPYKSKNKIGKRILLGLWAGVHYLFYIGNYNHRKYNTQTWYPEKIECVFGNISQMMLLLIYLFISAILFKIVEYYSLFFMAIPVITNIISIIKILNKKRRKR